MKCHEVSERASALIDGELPWWQALRLRTHLFVCEACRRFVRQLRMTKALTEAAAPHDAGDPATLERILHRVAGAEDAHPPHNL